jgi:chaperonin GroEL
MNDLNTTQSKLIFHSEAREKMISGVKQLAEAVKVTLGPKGLNVAIIRKNQRPHLTKDGVTVANSINLSDPFENLGCQIVKEAAQRTADVAGDGTTTSTVLATSLLLAGHKLLEAGHDAKEIVEAYEKACFDTLKQLETTKIDLADEEQLVSIASISANGEKNIGELIASAITKVGSDGPITVENAKGFETKLEFVEGTVIDQGFVSPYFATNQAKGLAELENVFVLCYNNTLNSAHAILPVLELAASSNRSLLIIANDFSTEALQALVMNKLKGALKVCAIKAPEFGNARSIALEDLATVTGGIVFGINGTDSKEEFNEFNLGYAEKIVVDKQGTVLVGTKGNKEIINDRLKTIQTSLLEPGLNEIETKVLMRRKRRLAEGIAIIRVGGTTEADVFERRDRVDDALCASKAAKSTGIQPGGGIAMLKAAHAVSNQNFKGKSSTYESAYKSFTQSCFEPFKAIVTNAGNYPEIVLEKILNKNNTYWGYNAANNEYGDMLKLKIVDPHAVVASSLKHATAVACNIIMIGCAISVEEETTDYGLLENL